MNIKPLNRYLIISLEERESRKPSVLVPEEYKIVDRHSLATVLNTSDDCKLNITKGDEIVVETSMVENISLGHEKICLILENYVYGVWEKE